MSKVDDIKSKVLIPSYFDKVIIPAMGDYYSDYTVDFEGRPVVKCPIHFEDTPSMRWYSETNTFYCFGCGAGGDVINLHRLFTEVNTGTKPSFDEAVEFIEKVMLNGNEVASASPVTTQKKIEVALSSNVEILRFNKYVLDMEKTLLIDKSIAENMKNAIYNRINIACELVALNRVNATEAMKFIRDYKKDL